VQGPRVGHRDPCVGLNTIPGKLTTTGCNNVENERATPSPFILGTISPPSFSVAVYITARCELARPFKGCAIFVTLFNQRGNDAITVLLRLTYIDGRHIQKP